MSLSSNTSKKVNRNVEYINRNFTEMRSNLMEKLSDEQKEIATDLPLNKLQKFVDMNVKEKPAATQESASTNMNLQQEPFTDMSKDKRRKNWKSIVDSYKQ